MADRIKFTVYRDKWLQGRPNDACLLNEHGERCCLGFLGAAVGIPNISQFTQPDPEEVNEEDVSKWPGSLVRDNGVRLRNSDLCGEIIRTNDSTVIENAERERELKQLFSSGGIDVTFEDAAPAEPTP